MTDLNKEQSKPLVHLLFIGIKTPEWCNDAQSGISSLLSKMKAEGSSIISIGDKEMTEEDNRNAYADLKIKFAEIRRDNRQHDRWVVVIDSNNLACTVHLQHEGNFIGYVHDNISPSLNFYLYPEQGMGQYDKPQTLHDQIIALQATVAELAKVDRHNTKLSEENPTSLIRSLLVMMVRHLNGPRSAENEAMLRTLINLAERLLRQGKLIPITHNQQQKGNTMSSKRKELKDLIGRAIGGLETDGQLTQVEKSQLVEDLQVVHDNLDTIAPEALVMQPASKTVNLILDGISLDIIGDENKALVSELQARGGKVFLFNQPNNMAGQDIGNAAALGEYLKVMHPESTWVTLTIEKDPNQERPANDAPHTSMMKHFNSKVHARNIISMSFGHNSRIARPVGALHGALMTQLTRVGDEVQPRYAPPLYEVNPAEVMEKVGKDVLGLKQTLDALFPKGMPFGEGMNSQVFGRGARPFGSQPSAQGYNPVGGPRPYPNSFGQAGGWMPQAENHPAHNFDGTLIVYVNGVTANNSWARFEKVVQAALPQAAVHVAQLTERHGRTLQHFVGEAEHSAKEAHGRNKVFHVVFLDSASAGMGHGHLREFQQQLIWGGLACATLSDVLQDPAALLHISTFGMELLQFMKRNPAFSTFGAQQPVSPQRYPAGPQSFSAFGMGNGYYSNGPVPLHLLNPSEKTQILRQFTGILNIHVVGQHNVFHLNQALPVIQSLIPNGKAVVLEYPLEDDNIMLVSERLAAYMNQQTNPDQLHMIVSPAGMMVPLAEPNPASNMGYMLHSQLAAGRYPGEGVVTLVQESAIAGNFQGHILPMFSDLILSLLQLQETHRSMRF